MLAIKKTLSYSAIPLKNKINQKMMSGQKTINMRKQCNPQTTKNTHQQGGDEHFFVPFFIFFPGKRTSSTITKNHNLKCIKHFSIVCLIKSQLPKEEQVNNLLHTLY